MSHHQWLTSLELNTLFTHLYKAYPDLLSSTNWDNGNFEEICGDITSRIARFLRKKGVEAHALEGKYNGRGCLRGGTYHCWVELWVTLLGRDMTIIIDGAYAQFYPMKTPSIVKDMVRLTIFYDDKEAQEWYEGTIWKNEEEKLCKIKKGKP